MYGTLRIPLLGFHYFSVVHIAKCDAIQRNFIIGLIVSFKISLPNTEAIYNEF